MFVSSPWLVRRPAPEAKLRLYCFPFAGGQAGVFAPWHGRLPGVELCAIQLPGRGARAGEPPMRSMSDIVRHVAQAIAEQGPHRFAFFGYSLGTLVAFEVARRLAARGSTRPLHLFASACDAPRDRALRTPLHLLQDVELSQALRDYGGTPLEVLQNKELMTILMPMLRADFGLVHDYAYHPQPLLDMPLTVFGGLRDPYGDIHAIHGWTDETTAASRIHWFDGDHFFLYSHADALLAEIAADLSTHTAAAAIA